MKKIDDLELILRKEILEESKINELMPLINELKIQFQEQEQEINNLEKLLEEAKGKKYFYQAAINALPNLIFMKTEKTEFCFLNDKYEQEFGIKKEEFMGKKVYDLEFLPKEDRDMYQIQDNEMIEKTTSIHYEHDYIFSDNKEHKALYWSSGFVVPETNERGLIGEIVDISNEEQLKNELDLSNMRLKQADEALKTDFATGLGNRLALELFMEEIINDTSSKDRKIAFIMADLDFFKAINDVHGHAVGDEVLREFAKMFQKACRDKDLCVRYGGEEFVAVLTDVNLLQANRIAQRLCDVVANAKILPNDEKLTVSLGLTMYQYNEDLDTCIARADDALYTTKKKGRNAVTIL